MTSSSIWIRSALIVIVTLAVISGLGTLKYLQLRAQWEAKPPPVAPIVVSTYLAEPTSFRRTATMIGTVLAPKSIVLSNEYPGTVTAIHFEPGQIAQEGEILVELDTSVLEAQLESAQARLRKAESTFRRITNASRVSAVTPDELDAAAATKEQAAAEVKELQATIDRNKLRAPFDARVGLSDTHEGQFLPVGAEIVSLQSVGDLPFVDFMVPQSASKSVSVGDPVQLMVGNRTIGARVYALDSQANRSSRNLMCRVQVIDDPNQQEATELLIPGDSVQVILEYGPPQDAVAIPAEALQTSPMQTFVFTVEKDTDDRLVAREKYVEPGPQIGEMIAIIAGLEAGEEVVTNGAFKLQNDAPLNPSSKSDATSDDTTNDRDRPSISLDAS